MSEPAQSPDEMFDVVDEQDQVIDQRRRADVHRLGLLHRAIHILVYNSAGEILLQKRSAAKDQFPLTWTSSASGHLDAGENYDEAAQREIQEELGFTATLTRLKKFSACQETAQEFIVVYQTVSDATPNYPPAEIESVDFLTIPELQIRIATTPESFAPSFLYIWKCLQGDGAPELG